MRYKIVKDMTCAASSSHFINPTPHSSVTSDGRPSLTSYSFLSYLLHLLRSIHVIAWKDAPTLFKISCIALFLCGIVPGLLLLVSYYIYNSKVVASSMANEESHGLQTSTISQEGQETEDPFLEADGGAILQAFLLDENAVRSPIYDGLLKAKSTFEDSESLHREITEKETQLSSFYTTFSSLFNSSEKEVIDAVDLAASKRFTNEDKLEETKALTLLKNSTLRFPRFFGKKKAEESLFEAVCAKSVLNELYEEKKAQELFDCLLTLMSHAPQNFALEKINLSIFFNGEKMDTHPCKERLPDYMIIRLNLPSTANKKDLTHIELINRIEKWGAPLLKNLEQNDKNRLLINIQCYLVSLVDPQKVPSRKQHDHLLKQSLTLTLSPGNDENTVNFVGAPDLGLSIKSSRIILLKNYKQEVVKTYLWNEVLFFESVVGPPGFTVRVERPCKCLLEGEVNAS